MVERSRRMTRIYGLYRGGLSTTASACCCTPRPGDYQGYLYCYDLREQQMRQRERLVGRVTYTSGERQEFTDPQEYLRTIQEELPYRNTTGFRYETLTDDPSVREAVDDILWDFVGEENPRRTNREITFGGLGK